MDENGPFIDYFPIKISIYRGCSMAMLNNQMVNDYNLAKYVGTFIPKLEI
jgi:hypothetical protein